MSSGALALAGELRQALGNVHWQVRQQEVGWIDRIGDGIAFLRGARTVRYAELLETADGRSALAFDIRPNEVGVLFLDSVAGIRAGDEMRLTGRVASTLVGPELLGRVVGPLGETHDGGPKLAGLVRWPVERPAPGVVDRVPVHEPLHTGTKTIDALLPIGRGQRELILGDRSTGKTAIAIDAILAQRGTGVLCVYASIGQDKASTAEVIDLLKENGALDYTVVVVSGADSPPGQQYLAPYAACTIGEYFMQQGRHVLVVYDDLTKHADAYRRVSLLLGRPPAREAYPADVFYLHARLLERATKLHDRLGGGSLTALPIATTQAGHISAYIPTNLISITDGQIYLDTGLFNAGLRPAINVGLSVSRVGGKAQSAILRRVAGDLKLLYAQLHELETFTRFGAELEPATRVRLERGRRLREALKQPRLKPWRVGHEVALFFAVGNGCLDSLPLSRVAEYLDALCRRLELADSDFLASLERDEELTEQMARRLMEACTAVARDLPASESSEASP
jgi:F-type H+-transporting ATPase subunit alpha